MKKILSLILIFLVVITIGFVLPSEHLQYYISIGFGNALFFLFLGGWFVFATFLSIILSFFLCLFIKSRYTHILIYLITLIPMGISSERIMHNMFTGESSMPKILYYFFLIILSMPFITLGTWTGFYLFKLLKKYL